MTTIIDLNTKPQVELSEGWNTPLGNALILIDLANGYIRFDAVNNQWLVWKGTHFQVDDKKTVGDLATRIPDILLAHTQQADLIAHITSNYSTAALVELEKWSEKSRQANLIQSTIQIAAMRNEIQLPPREVNESADILNTKTGTINLAANTTSKHDPNDNITKVTTVGVGDAAKCTNWLNTLDMVFDSQEMVDYFQRVAGYTLTGHVTEQCFFFLYGKGRNGKSTVVNALAYALGDYARKININTLSLDNGQQYELADLQGMRMVFTSEVEQGNHLAESLIKDFTGGDPISVRRPYGRPFVYYPQGKIWIAGNHKPRIRGTDDGIWRRVHLIPFTKKIPVAKVDPYMPEKLEVEAAHILAWAIEGLKMWQQGGLKTPAKIKQAAKAYRKEQDRIGEFWDECIIFPDPLNIGRTSHKDIFSVYEQWCKNNSEKAVSSRALATMLDERDVERRRGKPVVWNNIVLSKEGFRLLKP